MIADTESEVAAIFFCRIILFGETIDLFPLAEIPKDVRPYRDSRDDKVKTAFLIPSYIGDISARTFVKEYEIYRENAASALAATMFLTEVRGLPLEEILIETSSKLYKAKRMGNGGKCGILIKKCKQLYSNKTIFVNGIELFVSALTVEDRIYRIVKCSDVDMFSDESLRALLFTYGVECIDGVLAISGECGMYKVKCRLVSDQPSLKLYAALAAATKISFDNPMYEEIQIDIDGDIYLFRNSEDCFICYDLSAKIFTFRAPDFS